MTTEEAVAALDAIQPPEQRHRDAEGAHCDADEVLLQFVPPEVSAAYQRLVERVGAWWYA
jgi:hypothetical protein